jgi:hypothetical protein
VLNNDVVATAHNIGWRALARHGFTEMSPPEAEHAILELPTNRAEYVGVLEDMGDYPARSVIGQRVPTPEEVDQLNRIAGRWRAVVLLDDERGLRTAAMLFGRVFVLDPFYDSGGLLYAAWHDPLIRDDQSRLLAEQTGLLMRLAPLFSAGTAVLTPDHLPGSWNPRPGWRKPRSTEDRRQIAAWSVRRALVLLYWADRLNGAVCATRRDVIAGLDVALGVQARTISVELSEPARIDHAQTQRDARSAELSELWADLRITTRRRNRYALEDAAFVLGGLSESSSIGPLEKWRLALGERSIPDPAMLMRRVLNGQDPERDPPLPRKRLTRRPLCVMPA